MVVFFCCEFVQKSILQPNIFRIIKGSKYLACRYKHTMELENSYISKPFENGISGVIKDNTKWKNDKKSEPIALRPIAVCGPSGSGKSTLLKRLLSEYKDYFEFSISHTTRKPRPGEKADVDYHFVDRSEFEDAIQKGEFLEFAEFSGNIYGTSQKAVTKIQNKGKVCILDVEMCGVKSLKKTDLKPKFIFVKTPSIEILEKRLRSRNTETEDSLQKRLTRAKEELVYGEEPGNFDLVVVNDNLEDAYEQLKQFVLPDIEAMRKRMHH